MIHLYAWLSPLFQTCVYCLRVNSTCQDIANLHEMKSGPVLPHTLMSAMSESVSCQPIRGEYWGPGTNQRTGNLDNGGRCEGRRRASVGVCAASPLCLQMKRFDIIWTYLEFITMLLCWEMLSTANARLCSSPDILESEVFRQEFNILDDGNHVHIIVIWCWAMTAIFSFTDSLGPVWIFRIQQHTR